MIKNAEILSNVFANFSISDIWKSHLCWNAWHHSDGINNPESWFVPASCLHKIMSDFEFTICKKDKKMGILFQRKVICLLSPFGWLKIGSVTRWAIKRQCKVSSNHVWVCVVLLFPHKVSWSFIFISISIIKNLYTGNTSRPSGRSLLSLANQQSKFLFFFSYFL